MPPTPPDVQNTLPEQSIVVPPPELITYSPIETNTPATYSIFSSKQQKFMLLIGVLFTVSILGSFLTRLSDGFIILVYAWYLAVLLSLVVAPTWFIVGLVSWRKDHGRLFGSSIVFFLLMLVIGGGSCAVNMGLINLNMNF